MGTVWSWHRAPQAVGTGTQECLKPPRAGALLALAEDPATASSLPPENQGPCSSQPGWKPRIEQRDGGGGGGGRWRNVTLGRWPLAPAHSPAAWGPAPQHDPEHREGWGQHGSPVPWDGVPVLKDGVPAS